MKVFKITKHNHAYVFISREDEANFPDFTSIDEARAYFKKRYGDKYNFGIREYMGDDFIELYGGYIYFDDVNGQPVQIGENGYVHVVY